MKPSSAERNGPAVLRIAHTPPRYAPHIGGVEVVDQVLAEYSKNRGDEVVVICADEPRNAPSSVNEVPVVRLPWRLKVANTNVTVGLPLTLWRERWDVVHTHLPTPWSADVSVLVAWVRRRRSVVHFHNPVVGEGPAGVAATTYRRTVQRLTLTLADAVVVISPSRRDLLVAGQPKLAGKVHLVPNGVDLERFCPPDDLSERGAELLFVSVLDDFHEYKGLSVLLEAMVSVPAAVLHVVGDGPQRSRWEREGRALGIGERIHWEGAVDNLTLLQLYRSCGVFVLPSRTAHHEGGSSLVTLEAMACGLPVVLAEGVGDLSRQAASVGAGIHVPSDQVTALSQALATYVEDPVRRREDGGRARVHVEQHHSWEHACSAITALYRR